MTYNHMASNTIDAICRGRRADDSLARQERAHVRYQIRLTGICATTGWASGKGGDAECGHERKAKDRQQPHGLTDRNPDTAAYGGDAIEPWPNGICGHCGATQQAAGIGLEPTLSEWLDNIVAVGREIHRVLRMTARSGSTSGTPTRVAARGIRRTVSSTAISRKPMWAVSG